MAYVGVEFVDNGGISVVHESWLTPLRKEVFWPPRQTSTGFAKLLKSKKEPPEDNTWKINRIKRIFFETNSYEEAEKKIKKAVYTSDLQTDASEVQSIRTRVKRNKPVRQYSSTDEDVVTDTDFPKNNKTLCKRPPRINSYNLLSDSDDGPLQISNFGNNSQERTAFSPTQLTSSIGNQSDVQSPSLLKFSQTISPERTPSTSFSQSQLLTTRNRNRPRSSLNEINQNNISVPTTEVINLLKTIKEQNNQILEWIRKQNRSGYSSVITVLPEDIAAKFPMKNEEDVQTVEEFLEENNNSISLASHLSTLGGRDYVGHTNNILKYLFTNYCAVSYNFCGKRGIKKAFQRLKLKETIIRAVRTTTPQISERDIENSIKVWLKHSPERLRREQHVNP